MTQIKGKGIKIINEKFLSFWLMISIIYHLDGVLQLPRYLDVILIKTMTQMRKIRKKKNTTIKDNSDILYIDLNNCRHVKQNHSLIFNQIKEHDN